MDLKQIERIMFSMGRAQLKRLVLKKEGFELELEREDSFSHEGKKTMVRYTPEDFESKLARVSDTVPVTRFEKEGSIEKEIEVHLESDYILSPIVGTFYATPNPSDPSFVKVGDAVNEDSVVCIVEAMKVMNEVKSGKKGIIAEVLLENGEPVEFGTKMFRVK